MLGRPFKIIAFVLLLTGISLPKAFSFSLALDSIATWGKFPKFCVEAYRKGDRLINNYDTAYVQGTGYKFNIKSRTETWSDRYWFNLPDNYELQMASDQCTSTGLYLTYLAVSVGYDFNVSKIFGSREPARNRFIFQLNCSLFKVELSWINNNVSTNIRKFGTSSNMHTYNYRFPGINTDMFSVRAVYFFNHRKYSQAAALYYSRIQKRNQGSFYIGFDYWTQNFNFDFSMLPSDLRSQLPESWAEFDYRYNAVNNNYALVVGYGYNLVFARHWLLGLNIAPSIGLKSGYLNNNSEKKNSFSLFNRASASVVWNNKHWFAAAILKIDNSLIYDRNHSLLNTIINGELSVGYRFNLW